MSAELVKVDFRGDTLHAVREDGKVWVSLRRCCEVLGLDTASQWRKLKAKAWACIVEKTMQMPGDPQSRSFSMIELKSLPMWLAGIEARKVKEHVREKLAVYQLECHDVLAEHFLGKRETAPVVPLTGAEFLLHVAGQMVEQERRVASLERGHVELDRQMRDTAAVAVTCAARVEELKAKADRTLELVMLQARQPAAAGDPHAGRVALEHILDTPTLLQTVLDVADDFGGVHRALGRASGASKGLVHKIVSEERGLCARGGRLVPIPPAE